MGFIKVALTFSRGIGGAQCATSPNPLLSEPTKPGPARRFCRCCPRVYSPWLGPVACGGLRLYRRSPSRAVARRVPRLLEPPRIEAADLRPFDDDQEYIRAERGIKAVFAKAVHGIGLSASSVRSGSKATIAALAAGNAGMMSSEAHRMCAMSHCTELPQEGGVDCSDPPSLVHCDRGDFPGKTALGPAVWRKSSWSRVRGRRVIPPARVILRCRIMSDAVYALFLPSCGHLAVQAGGLRR